MEQSRFEFHGKAGELFKIWLVNAILTLFTFGFYFFWARVNVKRYVYQHITFDDLAFDWHATGRENLIGFFIGITMIALLGGSVLALQAGLSTVMKLDTTTTILTCGLYLLVVLFIAFPILLVRHMHYQLSRTSWSQSRFGFTGNIGELYKLFSTGMVLSMFTFFIYGAWFLHRLNKYMIKHTQCNSEKFNFIGDSVTFFFILFKVFFLSVLTLCLYTPWGIAELHRYLFNHTSIQGKSFKCTIQGSELLFFCIKAFFILFFTLGLGLPIVQVMFLKLFAASVYLDGRLDLESIQAIKDHHT